MEQLNADPRHLLGCANDHRRAARNIRRATRRMLLWFVLTSFLVLFAVPALAHSELVSSSPRGGETLSAPPREITLHFNESLEPKFSHFFVTVPSGTRTEAPAHVQGKDATLEWSSFVPQGASDVGSYTVDGRVLSVDGHQSDFRLTFTVHHAAPAQPAPGDGAQGGDGGSGEQQPSGPASPGEPAGRPGRPVLGGTWTWAVALAAIIAASIALVMGRRRQ